MDLVFNLKKMIIQLKPRMKHHLHLIGRHQQLDQHRRHRIDNLKLVIMLIHIHHKHRADSIRIHFLLSCALKNKNHLFFFFIMYFMLYTVCKQRVFSHYINVKYICPLKISQFLLNVSFYSRTNQ